MKRAGKLIERIADPENLRWAFWKASKGKRHTPKVWHYQSRLEDNLLSLRHQLLSGQVEVGRYHYFIIYDPKERQICASAFEERVLHHALMNVCHPVFDRYQIHHSYASRPGKGVHAALRRAASFTNTHRWFLKLDVRKYFASIHHQVLKRQLVRRFKDRRLLAIFTRIIDSYEASPGRGLPIGNLGSQYFANHYLAPLDHWAKEEAKARCYIRYMDDIFIWHNDKAYLKNLRNALTTYLHVHLKCEFKTTLLNRVHRGVPFCGFVLRPRSIRLSQRSKRRFIQKITLLQRQYHAGDWPETHCQRKALPLIAFTLHAHSRRFRQKVLAGIP